MNNYRPPAVQTGTDTEDRRASNSYLVFLGWIGIELTPFAIVLLSACGATLAPWHDRCWRDMSLLYGMASIPALIGQLIVGWLLTMAYNRRRMTSFATGSAAFVTSLAIVAALYVGYLAMLPGVD
ncbi:hypothetical protein [Kribbella catacumbae]|uniref:hypothetical protein n=1 Tax=Kribbella catacumbae TaxID=460086 RepID=UPI000361ECC7|nr:hypothetical protein [Kribbella catacumbae]